MDGKFLDFCQIASSVWCEEETTFFLQGSEESVTSFIPVKAAKAN